MVGVLTVCVPSRGRVYNQSSLVNLHLIELHRIGRIHLRVFVPACERREYQLTNPGIPLVVVPDTDRIGDILNHMVNDYPGRYKVVLDDDMSLLRRRDPLSISQKGGAATEEDCLALFIRLRWWMAKGYIHGGVSLRQTNHYCDGASYKENTRVSGLTFFDADVVRVEGIRFDDVQERSDFHVTLSLLELGYRNVCDYEFSVGQAAGGTNAPGGCSRYRTPEFLRAQAEDLARLHPGRITLVHKKRVGENLQAMAGEEGIPDVRVTWTRAFGTRRAERQYRLEGRAAKLNQ